MKFSFQLIVDPNGNPLPSSDPSGSLLTITIDSANPSVQTYSDLVTASPSRVATPEAGTILLLATGLVGPLLLKKRFRSSNSQ